MPLHNTAPTLAQQAFTALPEVLRLRAQQMPDQIAFIHLVDGESVEQQITYAQLLQRAEMIAAALLARHASGTRVLMLFEAGIDYIAGLFGVWLAGAAAVPSYPPVGSRALQRLAGIVTDAMPQMVLTNERFSRMKERILPALGSDFKQEDWIDIDQLPPADGSAMASIQGSDLALLQYTSGSTGSPKGVMLTHANLLNNCHYASSWMGGDMPRVGCTWLPPYHDMGLMGGILQPIYEGFMTVILAPGHFVQRPLRWLMAISKYSVTTSIAPNFAFDLCVDHILDDELAQLDLQRVQEIYCGAEPVRQHTFNRFVARFGPRGFKAQAFGPCYGLAEASVFVTGKGVNVMPGFLQVDKEQLAKDLIELVSPDDARATALASCGIASTGQRVRIVNAETAVALTEGMVGEIWVAAANTGVGYWNKAELSQTTFFATLADEPGHFMRTGDRGFLWQGQLYITGRMKDLIIVAGRNLYPQDIELAVEAADARIRTNGVAAFAVDDGVQERIGLVVEIRRHEKIDAAGLEALRIKIVESVTAASGAAPHIVHFAPINAIPLTTSGKLQRQATKLALLAGTVPGFKVEA
jgi:acyl-CoA synthetase (AMP-forming)/AMP-acid ligase II